MGLFSFSTGFTLLVVEQSFVTVGASLISTGLTLVALGLQEHFRVIATTPILRIEVPSEPTIKKPILITFPNFCIPNSRNSITIGYPRLIARNIGHGAAKDCVAQVKVLRRLSPDGSGECAGGPSGEYVDWLDLMWAGNVTRININPNDVRIINLIVMPLENNKPFFAGIWEKGCGGRPFYAWFARLDVLSTGCLNRSQDCLTKCIYEVEVQVTCKNGKVNPVRLMLIIGDDWDHTDIKLVNSTQP
ncbi:MAG: hypothetical protein ACP5H6_10495 [Caldivirga sp.]